MLPLPPFLLCAWMGSNFRREFRTQFNIIEEPCSDGVVHAFCGPCAICQEAYELKARGLTGAEMMYGMQGPYGMQGQMGMGGPMGGMQPMGGMSPGVQPMQAPGQQMMGMQPMQAPGMYGGTPAMGMGGGGFQY